MKTKTLIFTAEWCKVCAPIKQIVNQICTEREIELEIIDVENNDELATEYKIQSLPTVIVLKNGTEYHRLIGQHPAKTYQELIIK